MGEPIESPGLAGARSIAQRCGDPIDPTRPIREAVRAALAGIGPGLYAVACSGGADSLALADAAIEVAGAPNVVVVTIDHGLHEGSARTAAAVAAWARGRGAAAVVERVVVPRRASLEAAAREARYAALEAAADRLGAAAVLVGHTARDQAETVLLRIVRGTGPAGLAGMAARRGRFVRPLLALERAAIEAYAAARALPAHDDPMNDELRFSRVRARRELLPLLRRENPQLDAALVRLADSAREWLAVIDELAAPHARLPIACARLAPLPAAVRKRAVSRALEAAGVAHDAAHLDAIDRAVTRAPHGTIHIDVPGARLARTYDLLDIAASPDAGALQPPRGPYVLRAWQPGDRMKPARLRGRSRKLSDLYIDAKLPRAQRRTARVLVRTTTGAIVWAEYIGVAFDEPPDLAPARSGGGF